jgi:hypothetical protein
MTGITDLFFKIGEWATKNNPDRLLNFQWYMMWIMFIGFLTILISNLRRFFLTYEFSYLGWGIVMFAVLGLQYFSLRNIYLIKKAKKNQYIKEFANENIESIDEIRNMEGFAN